MIARSDMTCKLCHPVHQSDLEKCLTGLARRTPELIQEPAFAEACPVGPRPDLRLLVVEDNPVNQRVALRIIEKLGYHADLARNGREALDACTRTTYDLVLMDCQMPVMDGFEATAEIRRREHGDGHARIVAMTASALEEDRHRCLASGMDDCLVKPVKPADLLDAIERWQHR